MVIQEKVPSKTQRKQKQKYFRFLLDAERQRVLLVGVFWGMFIGSSWEKWQLKFQWGEIEEVGCEQSPALSQKKNREKKGNYSEDITLACLDMSLNVCAFTCMNWRPL